MPKYKLTCFGDKLAFDHQCNMLKMSTENGYTWYCKLPACLIEYEAWWLVRCTKSPQNFVEVNNNLPIWAIQPSFISMTTSALLRYFVWWVQRILVLFFNNPIIHFVYRCLATCVSTADNGSSRRYTDLSWKLYHNQVKAVSFTKWSQNEGLLWLQSGSLQIGWSKWGSSVVWYIPTTYVFSVYYHNVTI